MRVKPILNRDERKQLNLNNVITREYFILLDSINTIEAVLKNHEDVDVKVSWEVIKQKLEGGNHGSKN
jgi:hypothetical protein